MMTYNALTTRVPICPLNIRDSRNGHPKAEHLGGPSAEKADLLFEKVETVKGEPRKILKTFFLARWF